MKSTPALKPLVLLLCGMIHSGCSPLEVNPDLTGPAHPPPQGGELGHVPTGPGDGGVLELDGPPHPVTWRVATDNSGQFHQIQDAISTARSGDTIVIAQGTYLEAINLMGKALLLSGEGAPEDTILDGAGADVVLRMDNFESGATRIRNLTVTGSHPGDGTGIYIDNADPFLENVIVRGNGRGIYLANSLSTLMGVEIRDNVSSASGGGLAVLGFSRPFLQNCLIAHNRAQSGGGIYMWGGTVTLSQSVLVANGANTRGGSIYAQSSDVTPTTQLVLRNSVIAHTAQGEAITFNDANVHLSSDSTVFWDQGQGLEGGYFVSPVGRRGNLEVDPAWVGGWPDGSFEKRDLYLRPGSPLRDAGAGPGSDPDDSRADIGLFGGESAPFGWYTDHDRDGLFDGWEVEHGLSLLRRDGEEDPDSDTLNNREELQAGLSPGLADTDADGYNDGEELQNGSDPRDPFSPRAWARVPDQISRLDMAMLRAPVGSTLHISSGRLAGPLAFLGKDVRVEGEGIERSIIDGRGRTSAVTFTGGETPAAELQGLTLTGGVAPRGGGILMEGASPTLKDLHIVANHADVGGGIFARDSQATLTRVTLEANSASTSGGGLAVSGGQVWMEDSEVKANRSSRGGGVYLYGEGQPTLMKVWIHDNVATSQGGGLYTESATEVWITSLLLSQNKASQGGGGYLSSNSTWMEFATVVANLADEGGAFYTASTQAPWLSGVILAYGAGGGGVYVARNTAPPRLEYCLMWANSGGDFPGEWTGPVSDPDLWTADPLLAAEPWTGTWTREGVRPSPWSPVVDHGPGNLFDTDNSFSDIGLFGGPWADESWRDDLDADQLPDGWEGLWGGDLQYDEDLDGDLLSNGEEWQRGTNPTRLDTDDDAISDGTEVSTGSDPRTPLVMAERTP